MAKTPKERFSIGYITGRQSGLKELWSEFISNHKQIIVHESEQTTEYRKAIPYFKDDIFTKYEDIYYDILGRISQKFIELTPQPPVVVPNSNAAHNLQDQPNNAAQIDQRAPNLHQVHIPRLNVPNFSGLYTDWTSFHDIYVAQTSVPKVFVDWRCCTTSEEYSDYRRELHNSVEYFKGTVREQKSINYNNT